MPLGDDLMANRHFHPGTLSNGFRCKTWVKKPLLDLLRNSTSIISDCRLNPACVNGSSGNDNSAWTHLSLLITVLRFAFFNRINCVH
jgi:hypothetical protein